MRKPKFENDWKIKNDLQVIVEGKDDQMAFRAVALAMEATGLPYRQFDVYAADGQDNIPIKIKEFIRQPQFAAAASSVVTETCTAARPPSVGHPTSTIASSSSP